MRDKRWVVLMAGVSSEKVTPWHAAPRGLDRRRWLGEGSAAWVPSGTASGRGSGRWIASLMHTDRGSQDGAASYRQLLAQHGIPPRMSRKGNDWDNAGAELFLHT